jgi:hypothetical protein
LKMEIGWLFDVKIKLIARYLERDYSRWSSVGE